ncbi:EAL domain-containing protein (putative c-di-GMP-specific phosphodiesterase class I) [Sphingomonas vulcanisoli]|uniref:EAL domain-containing protein (Putative c-di-GMP-specific phosphodiesterase class I) n=1 Tax=Sphingomonas vulcanisoli TaxID=1658060 RepID=A0ABX0TPR9_9SPHN|nr:EAL domain-containing protein [Sphingomonas vulcanisoli]NIJ07502.1 EAL domain-containing protein (putative c-di-GMP-specific phosphodiesterase class I) [Sphingomonas vulcanisoli]
MTLAIGLAAGLVIGGKASRQTASDNAARPALEPEDALASDLDVAVARGQLFLVHQPKTHARTGEVVGMETLVRWQHPERGLIGPNDFIGLAEERGEIRRITEWVVRQALIEQRSLALCGHKLACSVNISACLLADREFGRWLLDAVRGAEGPFGLEITETAMIADPEGALANLRAFAEAGLRIAIDDYGAGLSSLAYLKQLPAQELKIDRMFIHGLSTSHRDPLLVRSTIDLAHALGMEVTAEGVDSPAAMALLRVMGCDHMQGFLIAKPLRLGELRAFLDARIERGATPENIEFPWPTAPDGAPSARRVSGDKG